MIPFSDVLITSQLGVQLLGPRAVLGQDRAEKLEMDLRPPTVPPNVGVSASGRPRLGCVKHPLKCGPGDQPFGVLVGADLSGWRTSCRQQRDASPVVEGIR